MARISKYTKDTGLNDKDILVGSNYISGSLGEEVYETATFPLSSLKTYMQASGDSVTVTTGDFTPQLIADTSSEFVVAAYGSTTAGQWTRVGNLVLCEFSIFITSANISGNSASTSPLSVQGWPYDVAGNGSDYQSISLQYAHGFDPEVKGVYGNYNSGLGNAKIYFYKQDTSVTTHFQLSSLKAGDFDNGYWIQVAGNFNYLTSDSATLNSGASAD